MIQGENFKKEVFMGKRVRCPTCRLEFELKDDLKVGDAIDCPECWDTLKIFSLNPPRLEIAYNGTYEDDEEGIIQDKFNEF